MPIDYASLINSGKPQQDPLTSSDTIRLMSKYAQNIAQQDVQATTPLDPTLQNVGMAVQSFQQPQTQQPEQNPVSNYQETEQLDPQGEWDDFVKRAKVVAKAENFPPDVLLSQAAIESGFGKSPAGQHNYFGLKGIGDAGQVTLPTQEYDPTSGYYNENSGFAQFSTPEANMRGYINLIKDSPNYKGAYQQWLQDHDSSAFVDGIAQGGYATDPNYADQIKGLLPKFQ